MDYVNDCLEGLLITVGFILLVVSVYRHRNTAPPFWAIVLSMMFIVGGACIAVFNGAKVTINISKAEWQSFAHSHNCKVVERNVPGRVHESDMSVWQCDDGVKYYKPEGYEKGFQK